jgi:uncharacterized protein YegP (UPF0339 family)
LGGNASPTLLLLVAAGRFRSIGCHLRRIAVPGEIIAASQEYESKASAEKGIEAIKTPAPGATVEDRTG